MKFRSKLEEGIFLRRYKRFFADIDWQGSVITAHVPNTGSMKSCAEPGSRCRFSVSDDPLRKLKYTLEMVQAPSGVWVGVNTATPNKIVREALEGGALSHWKSFVSVKPEAKLNDHTRFDFEALDQKGGKNYIEVKNVTLAQDGLALFPDAVTERGQKHLRELIRLSEEGHGTELIFTVQRRDVKGFAPADKIDPVYGQLLREAKKKGVRLTALFVELSDAGVELTSDLLPMNF